MSLLYARADGSEPIEVLALDFLTPPQPVTGVSNLKVYIRRASDDYFFDWSDNTFKDIAAVTTKLLTLTEVDAVNDKGRYRIHNPPTHDMEFNLAGIVNPVDDDTYFFSADQDGSRVLSTVPYTGEIRVGRWVEELFNREIQVYQSYSYNPSTYALVGLIWVEWNREIYTGATSASVTWYSSNGAALFTESGVGPDAQGFFRVEKATPGLVSNTLYYNVSSVVIPGIGTVKGGYAPFTVG